jgi:hypothetical protein
MNHAVKIGLGAMICIPSFIKTDSGIKKLIGVIIYIYIYRHTHKGKKAIS